MVFDTRTVDTMKESLAHYFEISCEELVEFIKEAADNTQAKSRGLFNADIFTEELDAFLENIEVTEQINGVMCFHFSRRITDDDNPIIRVADDAILPSEYIQSVEKITLDMLYA